MLRFFFFNLNTNYGIKYWRNDVFQSKINCGEKGEGSKSSGTQCIERWEFFLSLVIWAQWGVSELFLKWRLTKNSLKKQITTSAFSWVDDLNYAVWKDAKRNWENDFIPENNDSLRYFRTMRLFAKQTIRVKGYQFQVLRIHLHW